jgi:hypothetical protein
LGIFRLPDQKCGAGQIDAFVRLLHGSGEQAVERALLSGHERTHNKQEKTKQENKLKF